MLEIGKHYTRREISQLLGGSWRTCLPTKDGAILYGAFDTTFSPKAPYEILPDRGKRVQQLATQLCNAGKAIPVFVKRQNKQWEYCGRFRGVRYVTDPAEVARKQQEAGRQDVTGVLYLEPIETQD